MGHPQQSLNAPLAMSLLLLAAENFAKKLGLPRCHIVKPISQDATGFIIYFLIIIKNIHTHFIIYNFKNLILSY